MEKMKQKNVISLYTESADLKKKIEEEKKLVERKIKMKKKKKRKII